MTSTRDLIILLNKECDSSLSDDEWLDFLSLAEEIHLKKNQTLIEPDKVDRDVYIVKEGIIKCVDFDGQRERVNAFGFPGTIFKSASSFYKAIPSDLHFMACCPTVILRIAHDEFINYTETHHRFAMYALHYAWFELYLAHHRESTVHNGTTRERYLQVCKHRPRLTTEVSNQDLASYLGVTPQYLSRVKTAIMREQRRRQK